MAVEIKMPQLSDTMSSGKILNWKKNIGDTVTRGDILAEVETDKANLEIESFFQGTLLTIAIPAGSAAKVGELIAVLGEPGEAVNASTNGAGASASPTSSSVPQSVATTNTATQPNPQPQAPTPPTHTPKAASVISQSSPAEPLSFESGASRIKVSPLARKIAEQNHIDLRNISGSGPDGRIVKRDVERAGSSPSKAAATQTSASRVVPEKPLMRSTTLPPGANQNSGTLTPLSKMRDTIARRMQESVTQAPHFYSTVSVDMGAVVELREKLKAQSDFAGLSINHFVIKAAAYALQRESTVNCAMKDGQCYAPAQINIGIITAIDDGLLIPVIREVDNLSLKDLLFEAKAAVERARAGRPNSSDLMGGTFSISNMGMFDIENFTAIINPGQGAVLAVSATHDEAVVKGGQVVVAKRMKVTLSVDHRIIDGLMAARWLGHFKGALEQPALMFV